MSIVKPDPKLYPIMNIKKYLVPVLLIVVLFILPPSGHSKIDGTGTIENETYTVKVQIESGKLGIFIKNNITQKTSELQDKAVLVTNINKMFFLDKDSFIVEGNFSTGLALLIASIDADSSSIKIQEFRITRYLLNSDKTILIYSNWVPSPYKGPTYFTLIDIKGSVSKKRFDVEGKIIFDTDAVKEINENLIISPDEVIWGDKEKSIFFICKTMPELKDTYLFQYSFETEKTNLIKKLDKHPPHSPLQTFQWNENDKSIEIVYTGRDAPKEYIYFIYESDDIQK